MPRRALLVAVALGLALTSCGHSSSSSPASSRVAVSRSPVVACCPAPVDARADVVLVGIGGPVASRALHWAGTIHARGRTFTTVRTDARGHARLRLPAGRYRFTATSASYDGGRGVCRAAHPVRLRSHHTARVPVICQLK